MDIFILECNSINSKVSNLCLILIREVFFTAIFDGIKQKNK